MPEAEIETLANDVLEKGSHQRPNADRMGQSGNIKEVARPIHGEILPLSQLRRNLWPVG